MLTRRLLLGTVAAVPFAARADDAYPSKPIRVILPGPVGGLIDTAGRAISEAMQRELGQPWLIDPRPGASGVMAGQMLVAAAPDGYTLFLTVSGHVAAAFVLKLPYDPMTDFAPIAMIGVSTAVLCVPADSPAGNVAEFVAYAKANPGKLNYLNSGNGTGAHLLPELLKIKYGLDITSIYYKGLPPGVQDLLGGRLDLAMVSSTMVVGHIKAGRLKALALVGPKRISDLPGLPTLAEQGVGDIEVRSSLPLYGPKGLPTPLIDRLNKAVNAALADPDTRRHLAMAYIEPLPMSPAQVAAAMTAEHDRLGALIQKLGIKADGGT